MSRQEAIDLMLGRIKDRIESSNMGDYAIEIIEWEKTVKPVLEHDLKEFVAMIERELCPIA